MAEFKKSTKMLSLEKRLGRPLEEEILRLANERGLSGAAKELGVSKATLNYWMLKIGIRIRHVYLAPGEDVVTVTTKTSAPQLSNRI